MIICPNCKQQLEDGTAFCQHCGTKQPEMIKCSNCGKEINSGFSFCEWCGAPIAKEQQPVVQDEAPIEQAEQPAVQDKMPTEQNQEPISQNQFAQMPAQPKKKSKKGLIIGIIALLIIVAIVSAVFAVSLLGGKSDKNYALYVKDGEIFYNDFSKDGALQITSRLSNDYDDNEFFANNAYDIGLATFLSDDGKTLFYPDKIDGDYYMNLYYRDISKPESEPVKIDSEVFQYSVNDDATIVTYRKGEDNILYQYDMKKAEKTKIDTDAYNLEISDDGKTVVYLDGDDNIYIKHADKDKEKIDSDATGIVYVSEDFGTIYYLKDESLYKKADGKDKEKIATDIKSVLNVYDSGEMYYIKSNDDKSTLMDFVEDDMKESDAKLTKPEAPDSPFWDEYDTYEEYEKAYEEYEKEYDKYEEAYDEYWEKEERDEIREELKDMELSDIHTLCYYNGKEEKVVSNTFVQDSDSFANDVATMAFKSCDISSFEKIKLSEIESVYDVDDMVEEALYSSATPYVAVNEVATEVEQSTMDYVCFSPDGKKMSFLGDLDIDKETGDLYMMSISKGKSQKPELFDTEVSTSAKSFTGDGKLMYFKDFEEGKGDLYIDKNIVDYDVQAYQGTYNEDLDEIIFFTDWNEDKEYGTLKVYKDGKLTKVGDDIHDYFALPNGDILYLYDYSLNHYTGTLMLFNGKEAETIDEDVIALTRYDYGRGGYFYSW